MVWGGAPLKGTLANLQRGKLKRRVLRQDSPLPGITAIVTMRLGYSNYPRERLAKQK